MTKLTKQDAKRIQSATAKQSNGRVSKGSWAAKALSTADKKANLKNK